MTRGNEEGTLVSTSIDSFDHKNFIFYFWQKCLCF